MNFDRMLDYLIKLLPNLLVSLQIMAYTLLLGLVLGTLLTMAKLSKRKILRRLAYGYTSLMRGIPTLIMLFVIYYGLPSFISAVFNIKISSENKIVYVIVTMVLYSTSMISELMRSAYESIPKGQTEAALSIGESRFTALRRIVLPQAFVVIIPNLGDLIVSLMKEAALAFTIGVVDILGKISLLKLNSYGKYTVEMYVAGTLIFWVFSLLAQFVCNLLEHRFSKYKRTVQRQPARKRLDKKATFSNDAVS